MNASDGSTIEELAAAVSGADNSSATDWFSYYDTHMVLADAYEERGEQFKAKNCRDLGYSGLIRGREEAVSDCLALMIAYGQGYQALCSLCDEYRRLSRLLYEAYKERGAYGVVKAYQHSELDDLGIYSYLLNMFGPMTCEWLPLYRPYAPQGFGPRDVALEEES